MESKEAAELNQVKVEIKDALTCFICTSKVLDPVMCPKCKRLVCSKCIQKWFDEGHDKCPFCQTHTSSEEMITLPFMNNITDFFVNEVDKNVEEKFSEEKKNENIQDYNKIIDEEEEIDDFNSNINNDNKLSKTHMFPVKFNQFNENNEINNNNNRQKTELMKKGDYCPKHNEIIEYYCLNCNTKHCSKCLMFFNPESKLHENHKIISMEEKAKFNVDEIKNEIDKLKYTINELNEYKYNISIDITIIEKKEEFIKKVIEEFKDLYNKKSEDKKKKLNIKNNLINNQLDKINNVSNTYTESLKNFILREDENGFKEYKTKISNFSRELTKFKYLNNNNIFLKPFLKIYETDFLEINIDEYKETIGEIYFNIEGINRQLHLKLNSEALEEVLINLLIDLNAFGNEKDNNEKEKYNGIILIKNKSNIISVNLDEKMIHDNILILGRTIIKEGLRSIVNEQNKIQAKLILSYINF